MSTTNYSLDIEGNSIALLDSGGAGLPVLMLHGSGSSKEVFSRQFESPLANLFRLVAIDLPGHGQSADAEAPETGYTLPALAATCGAVLDRLGIERAAVFGWSLGGHVAIELLTRHRAVSGLMLAGTPPVGKGPLAGIRAFQLTREVLLGGKESFTPNEAERFLRMCFGARIEPGMREALARADGRMRPVVSRSLAGRDSADQRWVVEHTPLPVAMVNGADDPVVRLSFINGLDYANLWEGRCHTLARAGHAPFRDAPETFNQLFHRFLMDLTVTRARPGEVESTPVRAAREA